MLCEVGVRTSVVLAAAPIDAIEPGAWRQLPSVDASLQSSVQPEAGEVLLVEVPSVGAAVDTAIALQRLAARTRRRPVLRVGLAVGDVSGEVGAADLQGPAVVDARELLDQARPGQILATDLVARLDGGPGRRVEPAGVLNGSGRPTGPIETVDIGWSPLPTVLGTVLEPPGALELPISVPLVGRAEAFTRLDAAWAAAIGGRQQAVLVSGEAGSGKTRLVSDFARSAYDRGGLVLWGACGASTDVPFQPFVEALRPVLDALDSERRHRLLGDGADDLALLLPRRPGGADQAGAIDSGAARYWMFEAVAELLNRLAQEAPVMLVLDDLHWARESTTRLAEHVIRRPGGRRVCIIATLRDAADDLSEAARDLLGELARQPDVHRLVLSGLDDTALEHLVARLAGRGIDTDLRGLVAHLRRLTDGNPFFVGELWRTLVDAGLVQRIGGRWQLTGDPASAGSPAAVRDVITRRVGGLGADVATVLAVAALAGSPFDSRLVGRASGIGTDRTLRALDSSVGAGLVVEGTPGSYRFRHDLVAQALAEASPPNARRATHVAIGEALEALEPDRLRLIAHHYQLAVPLVSPDVPAERALQAARRALAVNEYDEAAATLAGALSVLDDPLRRVDLLIELSVVCARSGDLHDSIAAASEAAALAQDAGDPARLAAAASTFHEANWCSDGRIDGRPDLVEAALESAHGPDRARLLVSKATSLSFSGRDDEALAVGDEAIAVAREFGDDALLSRVIHGALYAGWLSPARLRERSALATEATELARRAGDREAVVRNLMKAVFAHSVLGRGVALRATIDELRELAPATRQPWLIAAMRAMESYACLGEGRLGEAEAAVEQFDSWRQRLPEPAAGLGMLMFGVRREQGRLAELRPVAELVARLGQESATWRPGLAALYAEVGLVDEAVALLEQIGRDGLRLERDHLRLVTLSYLADACVATAHPLAAVVYEQLAPWSGHAVWAPGIACYGAVDRYLGALAAVLGRIDAARVHLDAAVRFDDAAGWDTWRAHSRRARGEFLLEHGRLREAELGRQDLVLARELASRHGLVALDQRCEALLREARPGPRSASLSDREVEILRLVADGLTNREIGELLHASRHTVASHVHSILVKTGCANRTEAIQWAHRSRTLSPD
jgi:DNA-binding CsgD family transcriptional regulator